MQPTDQELATQVIRNNMEEADPFGLDPELQGRLKMVDNTMYGGNVTESSTDGDKTTVRARDRLGRDVVEIAGTEDGGERTFAAKTKDGTGATGEHAEVKYETDHDGNTSVTREHFNVHTGKVETYIGRLPNRAGSLVLRRAVRKVEDRQSPWQNTTSGKKVA